MDKYPKAFDQISGCAAPAYTPTARQSTFAVNSCTPKPELYQYTGSSWACLNCYPATLDASDIVVDNSGFNVLTGTDAQTVFEETDAVLSNTLNTTTSFGGDVSGTYDDLQLGAGVVGSTELASTAVTPGSYTNADITVDQDGRITAAANGTGGSGGGLDSTFAKINGTYTGKRITDAVYKTGTLGIRATDTTGVLNISNGSSLSDKIGTSIQPGGPYLLKVAKDVLSNSPVTGDFYNGRAYSDSASTAGENMVYNGGINYSPGGGHVHRYANAVGWGLENNFKNSPTEKGEPGFGFYEMQWPEVVYSDTVQGSDNIKRSTGVANNTKRRMIAGYASNQRPSYGGYFSVCSDQIPIVDWKTGTPRVMWTFAENTGNPKGFDFLDTCFLRFNKNNAGGILWANAAQNAFLGLFKIDNLNRVVLGYNNVNTLYTEGQFFNSIGPFTIAPLASQPLSLGSTSTTAQVDVYGIASVPFTIKSSVATNGMGFNVNNFDLSWRDLGTNNDVIRFDRGSPAFSIWIRATSGNVGFGAYPDSDISLHVKKTALGATSKLFGIENSTGKSVFYRTASTPSSGAAGDVTLSNISGVGDLWIHDGTANRALAKTIKATATLDFPSTLMFTNSDLTITATGAAVGDVAMVSPGTTDANSSYSAWVSATNTVTVRFNNYSAGAINPASATFNVIVIKY